MATHVFPLEVSQHGHSRMTWGFASSLGLWNPYALILFGYLQILTIGTLERAVFATLGYVWGRRRVAII